MTSTDNTALNEQKQAGTKKKNAPTSTPYTNQKSFSTFEAECLQHMASNNCAFDGPLITDGEIHRYSRDEKKHFEDEWYVCWAGTTEKGNDYLNCSYGSWSDQTKFLFSSFEKNDLTYTKQELAWLKEEQKKKLKETDASRKKDEAQRRQKASEAWEKASQNPSKKAHTEYLERKKIKPYDIRFGQAHIKRTGEQQATKEDCIIIKLQNSNREVQAVQYIFADGTKRIHGAKKGNYFLLGSVKQDSHILVCEGYATAASIFEAFNEKYPVFVAFDCGNLEAVVANIRKKCPLHAITIAGDDDCENETNTGKHHAELAAKRYNCRVVLPKFPQDFRLEKGKRPTDFNDLAVHFGHEEMQKQLASEEQKTILVAEKAAQSILQEHKSNERFSTKELPEPIRHYLDEIGQFSRADPIMSAGALIQTIGGHFKTHHLIPQGTYFQDLYPVAWVLNILESGGFKSTNQNLGSEIAYLTHEEILKEAEDAEKRYLLDKGLEQIEGKAKDAIFADIFRKDVLLPNLTTAGGLLQDLSRGRGGTIFLHELSVWLSKMETSYNEGLKELFTYLFDVPKTFDIKAKTEGTIRIERPFVNIFSLSALDGIKDQIKLSDIGSGFFARFLIFLPEKIEETPPALPTITDRSRIDAARDKVREILMIAASQKRVYSLSPDTKKMFKLIHDKMYEDFKKYHESAQKILEPYLKRWSPYLLKLAMIFQPFFEKEVGRNNQVLECPALLASSSVMELAICGTKHLFSHELGQSPHQVKCKKVRDYIAKQEGRVSRAKLIKSGCLDGGSLDYDYVIKTLLDTLEIKELKNPTSYCLCAREQQ